MDVGPILRSSLARARREALCWGGLWSTVAAAKLIERGGPPASVALVCALVTSWALVGGALVGLASGALDRASERWRVLASIALGGACCLYFLDASGLLPLLQGRQGHRRMLLVALGFAVVAALLSMAIRRYWRATRGQLLATPQARRTTGMIFAIAAAAGLAADAVVPLDLYRPLHAALHAGAMVTAALAASCLWARPMAPRLELRLLAVGVAVGAVPWLVPWSPAAAHVALATRGPDTLLRLARRATDWDGDGYSSRFAHGDCAPFRADIAPGKLDVPGNGVDENCLGGDRARAEARPEPAAAPAPVARARGVVLVTIDSLRADRAPPHAHAAEAMPSLLGWARDAIRFEHAYAAGGFTALSLSALLRGTYPRRLEWTRIDQTPRSRALRPGEARPLGPVTRTYGLPLHERRPTLQDLLRANGVSTGAVVDDGGFDVLSARLGGFAGFDSYVEVARMNVPPDRRDDAATTDAAIAALDGLSAGQRFFLWVHYFGPHLPTTWHAEVPRGEGGDGGYDHEVRFADLQLGRLLARISGFEQRGQRLTVIVTADHGEDLTRFERHHGLALDDGGLHVPLVLSLSDDRAGRTIAAPVSSVDVMPTVLAELGVAAPPGLDGIDLRRLASGEPLPDRVVISETWRFDHRGRRTVDQVAAISSRTSEVFDILDQDWLSGDAGAGATAERRSLTDYLEQVGDPDLGD